MYYLSSIRTRRVPLAGILTCLAIFSFAGICGQAQTILLSTPVYTVSLSEEEGNASLFIDVEGARIFRLPLVSGLSSPDREEELSSVSWKPLIDEKEARVLEVSAKSSIWKTRRFIWKFFPDHLEFQQFATGKGAVQRCYFFANGTSGSIKGRMPLLVNGNSTVYADKYFSPRANLADEFEYPVGFPQSLGTASEIARPGSYDAFWMNPLYTPPPLQLSYHHAGKWVGVGLGAHPGEYQFNGLEYSGALYAGASWWVNYQGRRSLDSNPFTSPVIALHFAHSAADTLRAYVNWMDQNRFSTQHSNPIARWHRLPIFCGWAEQTVEAKERGIAPRDYSTQANYEAWIAALEKRGIPFGTVVIDDKWQKQYGSFEVDEKKWPDMKGFIDRQHAAGRHVLLWVPALQSEGLAPELTVKILGQPVAADITNPKYEEMMRAQVKHLVHDLGVDGFKEDWINGMPDFSAAQQTEPVFGIEFVRRFQAVLYNEAHTWKKDAMVETQTPNPLMRESSDVLRLNDIWFGSRDLRRVMTQRAEIAWIAGWPLVDTDNAGSTNLAEWHDYLQFQPQLGIPALYFVNKTESTKEMVPDNIWVELAQVWQRYIDQLSQAYK